MKTTKQILTLAAAAMMLSAASAQQPQGTASIQVRGKAPAAEAEAQQPLVIVDGNVIDIKELKTINPSQIESINILKDNSAEQYASLGDVSNGVVIVKLHSPDDEVRVIADEMPTFLGGNLNTFRQWVQQQVRYPEAAMNKGIQGDVVVKFVIGKDGLIESSNIEILKSPDALLSDEVIRVLKNSPMWEAGRSGGDNVRVSLTLPVSFRVLDGSEGIKIRDKAESGGTSTVSGDNGQIVDDIVVMGFGNRKE